MMRGLVSVTYALALLAAVCMAVGRDFEELIERNQHLITDDMMSTMMREKRQANSQHWCCKGEVDTPVIVQQTRIVTGYKTNYYADVSHNSNCGTFGWSRCTNYQVTSRPASFTYITQYEHDMGRECPSHELVCCNGYVLLNEKGGNNCLSLKALTPEQKALLARLASYPGLLDG